MTVLLDTATVPARERADLFAAALQEAAAPAHLVLTGPDRDIRGRFEGWQFGAASLLRLHLGGFRMIRTSQQIRRTPAPQFAITFARGGAEVRFSRDEGRYRYREGQLFLGELNRPFEVEYTGGECVSFQVPHEALALPEETVRRAANRLPSTPLHHLLTTHLAMIADIADTLGDDSAASGLGNAALELTRALLITAAGRGDGVALPADILLTSIRAYVHRHLADPQLSPATIARAHHISLRYLYKLCTRSGIRLEQWILAQRLDRARAELTRPSPHDRTIAEIAKRYGFRDPAHFTHRFRIAYGMTPSQWRREAADRPACVIAPG